MEAIGKSQECDAQVEHLAREVGCFTGAAVGMLTGVKPETLEAWRKRGIGPPYARVGKVPLYPIEGVRRWISGRVRAREVA